MYRNAIESLVKWNSNKRKKRTEERDLNSSGKYLNTVGKQGKVFKELY